MAEDLGLRAVTMQQPFAAAMAAGVGLYTRRGKTTTFADGGEWIAIHCGANEEHLLNASLMAAVRAEWPDCPNDASLRAGMKCVLGVARFVSGSDDARGPAAARDPFLSRYECSKAVAWRADSARPCSAPMPYAKGQLQVWRLKAGGFENRSDASSLLALSRGAVDDGGAAAADAAPSSLPLVKTEAADGPPPPASTAPTPAAGTKRKATEPSDAGVKSERTTAALPPPPSEAALKRRACEVVALAFQYDKKKMARCTKGCEEAPEEWLRELWHADGEMECPEMHAWVREGEPSTAYVNPEGCIHEHKLVFKAAARGELALVRWSVCGG